MFNNKYRHPKSLLQKFVSAAFHGASAGRVSKQALSFLPIGTARKQQARKSHQQDHGKPSRYQPAQYALVGRPAGILRYVQRREYPGVETHDADRHENGDRPKFPAFAVSHGQRGKGRGPHDGGRVHDVLSKDNLNSHFPI